MNGADDSRPVNTHIQKAEEYPVAFPLNYPQQQEEEVHLRDYLHVLIRRKWTAITFLVITVTTVLIGTFLMTPVYRSSVTIKIDKENPNVLQFKDVVEVERAADDYYQTQFKILKSRNLAKRVIRQLKLDQNPEFAGHAAGQQKSSAAAAAVVENRNAEVSTDPRTVNTFLSRLNVEPLQKSMLVKVSFDSYSPAISAYIADTIAKSYIDFNIESKFNATQQAREWLEKQLEEMKARVERAEEALNKYAAQNGIIFLTERSHGPKESSDGRSIITQKLEELSTQLVQATSDRIAKEAMYREVQQGDSESIPPVLNNPLIQALKKDYANAEAEYSQLSRVYKPDYPKMVRLREQINQVRTRIAAETTRTVSGIKRDYEAALKREAYLQSTLEKYKTEALTLNEKMVQYQILKRETETNRELYNGLLQRLKETGISASLTSSNIQVLDRAEIPQSPHKPKKTLNLLIALITGLFGGIGLAFFVEYLDNTVKHPDDVEKGMSLPSLGIVPNVAGSVNSSSRPTIAHEDGKSTLSEAYRAIGTYIQFSSAVKPPKTMLITSARKGEGKTTTAVNTAITMAHSYGKGLIIDADMRNPQLHKIFDADPLNGLSSFLTGNIEFGDGLIKRTKIENLDIIPAGIIPPNPSELLSSFRMKDLVNGLFTLYSFVVIDSPPLLGLSDSIILSTLTDGVIVVVRSGDTPKDLVVRTKKLLCGVNAKILGVVLNGIKESDLRYGSYSYYSSYYYDEGTDGKGMKNKKRRHGDNA
jgi:capsular exopolysaccharide synthesis family protein